MQRLRKKSPNPTDQHVGNRVRMRRVMLNLTQTELADELGLSFQQVQKYEKGTNRIGASRLQDIARILRVPAAFFFEAVAELPPSVSKDERLGELTDFMATRDELALAKAFMRIGSIELRRGIVALVEEIKRSQA